MRSRPVPGSDPVQDRLAVDTVQGDTELLGHLPAQSIPGPLTRLDVTVGEIPHPGYQRRPGER